MIWTGKPDWLKKQTVTSVLGGTGIKSCHGEMQLHLSSFAKYAAAVCFRGVHPDPNPTNGIIVQHTFCHLVF